MLSSHFQFMPSRQIAALISVGGVVAIAAVFVIPIPLLWQLPAAALVAVIFADSIRRYAGLHGRPSAFIAGVAGGLIIRDNVGAVIVLDKNGHHAALGNIVYTFVSAWLSTVIINCGGRRYVALLLPDSLAPDDYRHLRIWLTRFGSEPDHDTIKSDRV